MTDFTINDVLASPEPPKREEHGGVIRISGSLAEMLGVDIRNSDTQGILQDTGVYAQVRERLLLPESYIIHGIYYRYLARYWEIIVEGADLPLLEENCEPPVITPIYSRIHLENDMFHTELKEIRIEEPWQRTYNPGELTAERL